MILNINVNFFNKMHFLREENEIKKIKLKVSLFVDFTVVDQRDL